MPYNEKEMEMEELDDEEDFDEQVERDRLKDKICKELGIKLIRIPYTLGGETERILSRKEFLDYLLKELNKLNINF